MKKALLPVRRRMRLRQGIIGLCWGLFALAVWTAGVLAASFLLPLESRNIWLAAGLPLPALGLTAGLLWPVSLMRAARQADACGLKERAQTALLLAERQDGMARLQREDAVARLREMDIAQALPLRWPKKPLLAAAACLLAAGALLLLPNSQDAVLRQRAELRQRLEKPAQAMEKAAEALPENALDPQTVRELRRLLGDLARQTRQARDAREALTDVSQAGQRMEKLLRDARSAAAEALGQAGLDALAQALSEGGDLEQALAGVDAETLAQAAQDTGNAAASASLQAAAQALSQANAAAAAQALSQMSLSGLSAGQVSAALSSAKAAAGGQGQGKGQGQGQGTGGGRGQGQGGASGAGEGSTNQDAGRGADESQASGSGGRPSRYNLGQYEEIYDPTRLGDGGQVSQSTGKVDENGTVSELTLSPGLGRADGSVPYDQVVGEYQAAAVQRAQEAALPGYAQQWVADYFSALTE